MKIKTSVLSVILFTFGVCAVTDANAGIFDKLDRGVTKVIGKAKHGVKTAGDKLSGFEKKASNVANQGVKKLNKGINTAVDKGKELRTQAVSTGKKIVTQAQDVKTTIKENARNNLSNIKGQLENLEEHAAKEFVGAVEQNEETDVQLPDGTAEVVYPEEVVEKIDALLPDVDTIRVTKTINLSESNLTDDDIQYLIKRLSDLATDGVKKVFLLLRSNSLTIKGVTELLDGLKPHPQFLKGISLSSNPIGDEGAVSLASYLEYMPMLKYIYLSDTGITGDAALALIGVMSKLSNSDDGSNLRLVDLSHNKIEETYLDPIVTNWKSAKNSQDIVLRLQDNPV